MTSIRNLWRKQKHWLKRFSPASGSPQNPPRVRYFRAIRLPDATYRWLPYNVGQPEDTQMLMPEQVRVVRELLRQFGQDLPVYDGPVQRAIPAENPPGGKS